MIYQWILFKLHFVQQCLDGSIWLWLMSCHWLSLAARFLSSLIASGKSPMRQSQFLS